MAHTKLSVWVMVGLLKLMLPPVMVLKLFVMVLMFKLIFLITAGDFVGFNKSKQIRLSE